MTDETELAASPEGRMMLAAGYEPRVIDSQTLAWCRATEDGSHLRICTHEGSPDGDPAVDEWYVGRHTDDGNFVECNDLLTLADAVAVGGLLPSPVRPDGEEVRMALSPSEIKP